MLDNFRADLRRYMSPGMSARDKVVEVALHPAVWAIAVYRFGRWVYTRRPPFVGPPLQLAYLAASKAIEITSGIHLYPSNDIGPGLYIGHTGSIHLNPAAKVGRNVSVSQEVTLGTAAGGREGAPVIGDDVYLGAGAKVIGNVKVGAGSSVAANSLVIADVPEGSTVMGVPARVMFRPDKPAAVPSGNGAPTKT